MVLLSRPDTDRLWLVIAALLAVGVVLLLASFQLPWYTATWTTGDVEAHGDFDFNEAELELYSGSQQLDSLTQVYADDSAFGDLMGRVEVLVGLGTFAALALGALLFTHYRGWFSHSRLIGLSWIIGVGGLAAGLVIFTLSAARAGADEVADLMAMTAQRFGSSAPPGAPDAVFWGTQTYFGGELVSAPGVGWLLAILALLNLVAAVLLLYQFPAGADQSEEADVQSFQVVSEESAQEERGEPIAVAYEPSRRG